MFFNFSLINTGCWSLTIKKARKQFTASVVKLELQSIPTKFQILFYIIYSQHHSLVLIGPWTSQPLCEPSFMASVTSHFNKSDPARSYPTLYVRVVASSHYCVSETLGKSVGTVSGHIANNISYFLSSIMYVRGIFKCGGWGKITHTNSRWPGRPRDTPLSAVSYSSATPIPWSGYN